LYVAAILTGLAGFGIMTICIIKYFYELSGLQAIQHSQAKNTLQQSGLHKYVRHPLYFGTLLFVWSLFFVFPSLSNLIAAIIITLYTLLGIRLEEKKLMLAYGDTYTAYIKRVPMLIPGLKL
jgi:protein-S-isoprenylcysteine O-methyltransferase Ste14